MSMIWDAPLASAVAKELNARLAGARLRGFLIDWNRRELTLFFRSHTLRWALHPAEGWVTLSPPEEPPDALRPLAAEVLEVQALPDERVLRILLRRVRGRVRVVQVVIELITNQWNALILEEAAGWIRHIVSSRRSGDRDLSVGRAYRPPDPTLRKGRDRDLTETDWGRLFGGPESEEDPSTLLE
ncbi:MAG: hypothetical protein HKO65_18560, partial [Gemmatimonadetes bacterium]|nr:hypothetical protein [Gemmatimonadota bacterium]